MKNLKKPISWRTDFLNSPKVTLPTCVGIPEDGVGGVTVGGGVEVVAFGIGGMVAAGDTDGVTMGVGMTFKARADRRIRF